MSIYGNLNCYYLKLQKQEAPGPPAHHCGGDGHSYHPVHPDGGYEPADDIHR